VLNRFDAQVFQGCSSDIASSCQLCLSVIKDQILNRGSMTCIAMGLTGVASMIRVFGEERIQYWREASGLPQPWWVCCICSTATNTVKFTMSHCCPWRGYSVMFGSVCDSMCLLFTRFSEFKGAEICLLALVFSFRIQTRVHFLQAYNWVLLRERPCLPASSMYRLADML
jgi:hypothetical protein